MKKATCTTFVNILNTIHEVGITTKEALMANQYLYNEFGSALMDFCHFALRSNGNIRKIDELEKRGVATRADLESDCVMKIIEKLDRILHQPIEKQKNYCYTICNHLLDDCFDLPQNKFTTVSLDSTIKGTSVDVEEAYTWLDTIGDDTYNPEHMHIGRETIRELKNELKAKQAKEQAEKNEAILNEVALLSKRPAEVMVRLACTHLSMKPRQLADIIIGKGSELAYAEIIFEVARQNHIELKKIRSIIAGHELTAESIKADTSSAEQVAGQISRLAYRAVKRLNK